MSQPSNLPADPAARPASMTKAQARKLTDQIIAKGEEWCVLLVEARDGNAWAALGYASWDQYAATELNRGRSSVFREVTRGDVILALETGTPIPRSGLARTVTQRQASILKADLPAAVAEIGAAVERGEPIEAAVVEAVRTRAPIKPDNPDAGVGGTLRAAARQLLSAEPDYAVKHLPAETLDRLFGWVRDVKAMRGDSTTVKPVRPVTSSVTTGRRISDLPAPGQKCVHPISRRIGTNCGLCGESAKAR